MLAALLFDLDGTLIDTNDAHADAYAEALLARGVAVPQRDALRLIGKGGDFLLPDLIGEEAAREEKDVVNKLKRAAFERIARERPFCVLPGAESVLEAARARGLRLALCTAADGQDLDTIFGSAGVDFRPYFEVVTTATDADRPKPEPDVLEVAMGKLGIGPEACALVGDTIYDGQTAAKVGVAFLGVLTGPWSEAELLGAGARAVYADVGALAADLDAALALAAREPA